MSVNLLRRASRHLRHGRTSEAIRDCELVLAEHSTNAAATHTMGLAQYREGNVSRALELLQRSIELDSAVSDYHNNLGCVLDQLGNIPEAMICFRHAIQLDAKNLSAYRNIAASLERQGRFSDALEGLDQILQADPSFVDAHAGRGSVLQRLFRFNDALKAYRAALSLHSDHLFARRGAAACLDALGRAEELIDTACQTVRLFPNSASDHSDLIQLLHYDGATSASALCKEAKAWATRHAIGDRETGTIHRNEPIGWKRLRVGYCSPDFRDHPLGRLFLPVLSSHNRQAFEIFCYSDAPHPDDWTSRLRALSDRWQDTSRMSDSNLGKKIEEDRIDILVELAGHFPRNRLQMISSRPAPVQITALAYMGTTGLSTIDYRITDCHSDPEGMTEGQSTEELIRLPHCAFCYLPPDDAPNVGQLPAASNGFMTFVSLNRLCKITDSVLNSSS